MKCCLVLLQLIYALLYTATPLFVVNNEPILEEIHGYHFHTYFFQNNANSTNEATKFRNMIQELINGGTLEGCRLNVVHMGPRGPHPIGNYETCCNKTSMTNALSWFIQNRGNLSVLLHPLTRWEVQDHTTRAMFLGRTLPMDVSALTEDLGENLDRCRALPAI